MNRRAIAMLLLTGCAAPQPVLVLPTEVEDPPTDTEALGATKAAAEGRGGTTVIEYCITPEGSVDKVTVQQSQDPEVDAVFVEQVEGRKYEPATRDGEPYEYCTKESFDFRPLPMEQ